MGKIKGLITALIAGSLIMTANLAFADDGINSNDTTSNNSSTSSDTETFSALDKDSLDIGKFLYENPALDDTCEGNNTDNCFSFLVSPTKIDLSSDNVENNEAKRVLVWNNGNVESTLKFSASELIQGPDGDIKVSQDSEKDFNKYIDIYPSEVSLTKNQAQYVYISVKDFDNAPVGDLNLILTAERETSNNSAQIIPKLNISLNVFIPGEVRHNLVINGAETFKQDTLSKDLGWIQSGNPINLDYTLENKGNIHETVGKNTILGKVKGWSWGPFETNLPTVDTDVILKNTKLTKDFQWGEQKIDETASAPAICFCTATYTVTDGLGNTAVYEYSFKIFPIWQTIVGLIIFVILIGALIIFVIKRRKNKNSESEEKVSELDKDNTAEDVEILVKEDIFDERE